MDNAITTTREKHSFMSKQKKIDSNDISQKFGIKIMEQDLIPKTKTAQHGMKQFANLSAILKENNFKVRDEKETSSDAIQKTEKHDSKQKGNCIVDTSGETFSDIYSRMESASAIKCDRNSEPAKKSKNFNGKSPWEKAEKQVQAQEPDDFAKYLKSSAMIIPDKDSEYPDK